MTQTQTARRSPPQHVPEPGWGESLSAGAPGIALLHIERARVGTGGWDTAAQWAAAMTSRPVTANADSGLYRGAPAIAFVLHAAGQPVYDSALDALDGHIATLTRHRLDQAHERINTAALPTMREFDLISGLTGLGAYLLHRHPDGDLLRDVLAYLVRLAAPLNVDGEALPGWWVPGGGDDRPALRWPGGHANLGIAHGIAGPLALLSTAARHGTTVHGQPEAIDHICTWLDQWRCDTGTGAWWPGMLSLLEWRTGTVSQHGPQRPGWCYAAGLARAQQLAALALDDPPRQRRAEETLAGCITDEQQLAQLGDPSLCHGWAGLIQTTWRAVADSDSGPLAEAAAEHLPGLHRRMEQSLRRAQPPDDGLIEGSAGVHLVQHTTTTSSPPASGWDACLLLNG